MKIQQTIFLILFSFGMLALLAVIGGCDRTVTQSGSTASGLRINASISQAINGETLDFVRLVVSGRDMTTINQTYPIIDGRYFEAELDLTTGERTFLLTAETIDSLISTETGLDTISHAVYRGTVTEIVRPVADFEIDILLEPVVPLIKLVSRYVEVPSGGEFTVDLVVRNIPNLWQLGVVIDFGYNMDPHPVPIRAVKSPTQRSSVFFDASLFNDDTQFQILMVDSSQFLPRPLVDANGDATLGTITFQAPHVASQTPLALVPLTLEIFIIQAIGGATIPEEDIFLDQSQVRILPVLDVVVTFPDAALDTAARWNLSIQSGDIMLSDLLSLSSFYWQDDGIQIADLTNFDMMRNLENVSLAYQTFTDLTPIGNLENLEFLEVTGMSIVNISPLANNIKLYGLVLDYNDIQNLSALQGLTELTYVNLGYNQIVNLTPLQGLTELQTVDLRFNAITDIQSLVDNVGIGSGDQINLSGNPLNNTSLQTYLPQLRQRGVLVTYP